MSDTLVNPLTGRSIKRHSRTHERLLKDGVLQPEADPLPKCKDIDLMSDEEIDALYYKLKKRVEKERSSIIDT